jgi:hypothetical protein
LGLDLSPALPPTLPVESITQEQEGNLDAAIEGFSRIADNRPELMGFLGHALARADRRSEALECVERLRGQPVKAPLDIARVYLGLEDADEALRWLAAAVAQRQPHLILMPADPRFDWLRRDPRYADVVRPMALG